MCGVDFGDTTQAVTLTLCMKTGDDERRHVIAITAPVGEQLEPLLITQNQFKILHGKNGLSPLFRVSRVYRPSIGTVRDKRQSDAQGGLGGNR